MSRRIVVFIAALIPNRAAIDPLHKRMEFAALGRVVGVGCDIHGRGNRKMITDAQIEAIAAKWRAKDHPEYSLEDALADAARLAVASCPRGDDERQAFLDKAIIAIAEGWMANPEESDLPSGEVERLIVLSANELWQAREDDRLARMKGES